MAQKIGSGSFSVNPSPVTALPTGSQLLREVYFSLFFHMPELSHKVSQNLKIGPFDITYGSPFFMLWRLLSPLWATVLRYKCGCSYLAKCLYVCVIMKSCTLHATCLALGINCTALYQWRNNDS